MKQRAIIAGLEGKISMLGVFAVMQTPQNNLLARALNKFKKPYFRSYTDQDVQKFKRFNQLPLEDSIVIRWGTRIDFNEENCIVYNNLQSITNSSHKYNSRLLFKEAGVRIPSLVTPNEFQLEYLPVVARPFKHKQGKNFVTFNDFGSFENFYHRNRNGWYFSAYIDKDSEYRVHCAHGRILSVMKKPKPEDPNIKAWNHAEVEEAFEAVPWSEWNLDMCRQALKAIEALGLDFGAVDVIVKNNVPYVLEANTSPSLTSSPYNTEKYAKYFDWLLKSDERRPHFNFEDKQKAASLAWKQWMFEDCEPNPINKK